MSAMCSRGIFPDIRYENNVPSSKNMKKNIHFSKQLSINKRSVHICVRAVSLSNDSGVN